MFVSGWGRAYSCTYISIEVHGLSLSGGNSGAPGHFVIGYFVTVILPQNILSPGHSVRLTFRHRTFQLMDIPAIYSMTSYLNECISK